MSEHITHTPTIKRLERTSDRMLAGVAGGLGRYFDLNPAFFRIGFVVLTLLGGAGILVYLAAALVMPAEGKERSTAEQILAERRERPWPLVGLAIVAVALAVLVSHANLWPTAGAGWFILLLVGLSILWASRGKRPFGIVVGLLSAVTALVLGAAIAAVALSFAWFNVSLNDGVGDRFYSPSSLAAVQPSYKLGVGNLHIDLSAVGHETKTVQISARVGVGKLLVTVPAGTAVAVNAHAKVGDVHVFNQHDDGQNAEIHTGPGVLTINANVGAGRIDVERATP